MAYSVPQFPLTAGIWWFDANSNFALRDTAPCNVAIGRRVTTPDLDLQGGTGVLLSHLLFPLGTDVRDSFGDGPEDTIEVPLGSSRWYTCIWVNDLGQGFANEHRLALCQKATWVSPWPTPLPPVWQGAGLVVRRVGDVLVPVLRPNRATVRA